jgi:hypothetical protein
MGGITVYNQALLINLATFHRVCCVMFSPRVQELWNVPLTGLL